ncbi:BatD family protein [Veronia nyctiphanis]|uniref:BatD family protein n=1 Tax=Veronia nyctiphanis TaxID=1278244 RepID=UPI001375F002|nr:BatD family protein [Veronia nyctiphanis]
MKKSHFFKTFLLFVLFAFAGMSNARALEAVATVSDNPVSVNQVFELTVTVNGNVDSDSLDISSLKQDFQVGRPSVSSATNWINGEFSQNVTWKIGLAARKEGTFTIPSLDISGAKTTPIRVKVKKANINATQQLDIQIETSLERTTLYVGESTRYQLRIFIAENLQEASLTAPSAPGLSVEQIGEDQRQDVVKNGKRYLMITRTYQVTPQVDGTMTITGSQLIGSVVRQGRRFGSSVNIPVDRKSDDITLSVAPIPASFKGLWLPTPDLNLLQDWQPESTTVAAGEPITRIITLRVKNVSQSRLPDIKLSYPDSVRVYDEKPIYGDEDGYTIMTLKQVIIPKSEGSITLPGLVIPWWDTVSGTEKSSEISPLTLTVTPAKEQSLPTVGTSPVQVAPQTQNVNDVVTIVDAGIWPYVSALLGVLWLATATGWVVTSRRQRIDSPDFSFNAPTRSENLFDAVKENHPIQIQNAYKRWRQDNHPKKIKDSVKHEIEKMNASMYSKETTSWDNKKLLEMLEKSNGKKLQENRTDTDLAPLVPSNNR